MEAEGVGTGAVEGDGAGALGEQDARTSSKAASGRSADRFIQNLLSGAGKGRTLKALEYLIIPFFRACVNG